MAGKEKKGAKGKGKSNKRPFGDKVRGVWQRYILGKKEEAQSVTPSTKTSSLSSEQRNKLAAEAATSGLRLDQKTKDQVAKALAAEMQRRHMEREQRRKELLCASKVRLPWGQAKKTVNAKYVAKTISPSPGATVFPIKMVPKQQVKRAVGRDVAVAAEIEDDAVEWHPVGAIQPVHVVARPKVPGQSKRPPVSAGPSLEEQRKTWLLKSLKNTTSSKGSLNMKSSTKQSQMLAGPATPSMISQKSSRNASTAGSVQTFGSQPTELQIDDSTAREIHSHTFEKMIENIVREARQGKKTAEAAKSSRMKHPQDMTPDELVELLRKDPNAWDQYTQQNTVITFGVVAPTDEDLKHGQKTKKRQRAQKVTFESEIDVTRAPVGKDFAFNEKKNTSKGTLKK